MNITEIITPDGWIGDAEQVECVRQFARDFNWDDVVFGGDAINSAIADLGPMHPEAEAKLRGALQASAERSA